MRSIAAALTAAAVFASSVVADLDPIVIKGSKFFYKTNGTQFFIQGVAYQQDVGSNGTLTGTQQYTDPLADAARCQVDIPLLKQLRTNTIRVYAVDPTKDHTTCMKLLQDNGIYIIADLGEPSTSINRETPAWNDALYARYTSVVDMFAPYSNVIGFFAGNEVSNNNTNTGGSAFVKAAVRDTKAYIKAKNYRTMGVGYATNDDAAIRENLANYFNCGDADSAIDFWGYNIYSWCGASSFTQSGYDQRVAEFKSYSVPSFFAEYGCNTVQPREFTEVESIFGSDMTGTFSGGIVYMYFQEANNYGLVDISSGSVVKRSDFTALSTQMASIAPTGVQMAQYTPSNTAAACPAVSAGVWEAKSSPLPPSANPSLCSCMYSSLSCVVKSSTDQLSYGKLFNQVCGYGTSCNGIVANASTGSYGAYSVCNATEQLSFAMDQYYKSQKSSAGACDFGGAANVKTASSASGSCSGLLSQAGSSGTGQVVSQASVAATTSKAAAGMVSVPALSSSSLLMGLWVAGAAVLGATTIVL